MVKITEKDKLNAIICLVAGTFGFVLVLSCVIYFMNQLITKIHTQEQTIQEQTQEIETLRTSGWMKQEKVYQLHRINELLPVLEQVMTKLQIRELRAIGEQLKQEQAK